MLLMAAAIAAPPPAMTAANDGPITRQTALERADTLFELLDTNHDGVLTRGEAERSTLRLRLLAASLHRDIAHGIGGHTARFYRERFAESRTVGRAEFEQAMLDHFDRMDRNHDGILTADERAEAQ